MDYKTEQEVFWTSSEWGDAYMDRKSFNKIEIKPYINFFSRILKKEYNVKSVIEFGSNIGLNLVALKSMLPKAEYSAIEINDSACKELEKLDFIENIYNQSLLEFESEKKSDLAIIKTVLIHINPEYLDLVYEKLYNVSNKYILIAEYYSPTPAEIVYRGHDDKLFKRDFAGEIMNKYSDLKLIDYGFAYHKDERFAQDDVTWFLLEKV